MTNQLKRVAHVVNHFAIKLLVILCANRIGSTVLLAWAVMSKLFKMYKIYSGARTYFFTAPYKNDDLTLYTVAGSFLVNNYITIKNSRKTQEKRKMQ